MGLLNALSISVTNGVRISISSAGDTVVDTYVCVRAMADKYPEMIRPATDSVGTVGVRLIDA